MVSGFPSPLVGEGQGERGHPMLYRQAGSGPAAADFSCFAKKSQQKKATARRWPAASRCHEGKSGKQKELAALKHFLFLIRFCHRVIGNVSSGKNKNHPRDRQFQ